MRFSYRKEFATEPIAEALRRRGWEGVVSDHPGKALLDNSADIIIAPALDYARSLGLVDYALVPGFGIITGGFAGMLKLVFNRGLVNFSSLAVRDATAAETAIARMVLMEKHDIDPRIITVPEGTSLDAMLQHADAALLAGDDAIFNAGARTTLLDLSDEWEDAMEAPLPYMLAWGRTGEVPQGAIDELLAARDEAVLTLADRAAQHQQSAEANVFYQRYLRGDITYTLDVAGLAAADVLYRYAFYYSVIADMPALKLLPEGEPAMIPIRPENGNPGRADAPDQSQQQQ